MCANMWAVVKKLERNTRLENACIYCGPEKIFKVGEYIMVLNKNYKVVLHVIDYKYSSTIEIQFKDIIYKFLRLKKSGVSNDALVSHILVSISKYENIINCKHLSVIPITDTIRYACSNKLLKVIPKDYSKDKGLINMNIFDRVIKHRLQESCEAFSEGQLISGYDIENPDRIIQFQIKNIEPKECTKIAKGTLIYFEFDSIPRENWMGSYNLTNADLYEAMTNMYEIISQKISNLEKNLEDIVEKNNVKNLLK